MLALLPMLAGDIPWSAGGLMRCFDMVSEEGTHQQRHVPGRGQPRPDRPGVADRHARRRVPVADARPVGRPRQERAGRVLRHLGHRRHRRARRTRRRPDAVPQHHDGADGRRLRRPPGRRRHGHRRAVLHPDGPHPRRRDDRVPLPAAHAVAARGARLGRTGPASRRRQRLDRDHAARHQLPMGLVLASAGKAVAQNTGLAGGYPGNTGLDVLARGADVARAARGRARSRSARRTRRRRESASATRRPISHPATCCTCTGRAGAATATRCCATPPRWPPTCARARSPRGPRVGVRRGPARRWGRRRRHARLRVGCGDERRQRALDARDDR